MEFINPTAEQFKELMQQSYKGPIVMVNLLKFKPDGGKELYQKYGEVAGEFVIEKLGGKLIYMGDCLMPVIGDEQWDEVLIVEYPSIEAFISMQRDKEYQAAVPYRTEALLDSRLYLTKAAE